MSIEDPHHELKILLLQSKAVSEKMAQLSQRSADLDKKIQIVRERIQNRRPIARRYSV